MPSSRSTVQLTRVTEAGPERALPTNDLVLTMQAIVSGALALPALAIYGRPAHASFVLVLSALAISVVAYLGILLTHGSSRFLVLTGVLIAAIDSWLLTQTSYPAAGLLIAPTFGAAVALATGREAVSGRRTALLLVTGVTAALVLASVRITTSRDAAIVVSLVVLAACAAGSFRFRRGRVSRRQGALGLGASVLSLLTVAWIGATTPAAAWFGDLDTHGPRDGDRVAITFDDGPDPPYTLAIRDVLDQYGVKATFFTVGKALAARPDVSRALLDDGQLLGNHSYHHDAFRWLDPGYAELGETQNVFRRELGVCPALFRPPHGTHTPLMAREVSNRDMTMVTWDVSAGDWATDDAALVARRVLDRVKPGSIILLHDGIDGNIGADRSVVVAALPMILDGLRERGLHPVTLDTLLGIKGYLDQC